MLKKVASYIFIVFGLLVLAASTSRTAMEYISAHRDSEKWWGAYPCQHGDLVSLSYLDFVDAFKPPRNVPPRKPEYNGPANIDLYIHGDSYIFHLPDTDFAAVSHYYPIDRNHGLNYHLDTTRKNILIIEVSERYIRYYFSNLRMLDEMCDSVIKKKNIALSSFPPGQYSYASLTEGIHLDKLFNKYINQNLQCNLFNYNFIIPMFEYKAALNYHLFNRASGDVVISDDRKFLFLKETVSKTDMGSSYSPVYPGDVAQLVGNFNAIYDHYKKNGFSEVYLSMIPNSATIIQPEGYNNLIPAIQNDPRLRIKLIDVYTAFKNSDKLLYLPGDTHWNSTGRQLWLDMVNNTITK